ncbi:helicase C-terminal domain-containing protein [Haliea sp. E17]|uniref:helicase C-terminal domain-containing protein n=1 Tax=Haliea sp. E17 TaxID=3401576 RepID=UPI003AAA5837
MTEYRIGVRDLAAFCHRRGSIDHRFTPSPTGEQGMQGHERIYRRRPASYRREYAVSRRVDCGDITLLLQGRADGYDPEQCLLEEIKTCRVPFSAIPAEVSQQHLAQARLYAALVAAEEGLDALLVRLTWLNIDSDEEQALDQHYSAGQLAEFLDATLADFAGWLQALHRLRLARGASIGSLAFPHGEFRPGQRDIAELAYKCIDRGGQLLIEAPTGIGKTAAVLFPALKALGLAKHDALVFVTFRTVGRRAAEECLRLMQGEGLIASSLSLSAKDSVCLSPGSACHGDDCVYARGYYDRLPAAMRDALDGGVLDSEQMQAIGRSHQVCPYQLAEDMLPWCDIVIADAHYIYSLNSGMGRRIGGDSRRWSLLVDEAHNLPDRARGMYSARLEKAALMRARGEAPSAVRRTLDALNRSLLELQKESWAARGWDSRPGLPEQFSGRLAECTAAVGGALADDPRFAPRHPEVMDFFFALLHWSRVAEHWGDDFRFELTLGAGKQGLVLELRCIDPARLLALAQQRVHALVAFSATLSPAGWMQRSLGLAGGGVARRFDSPFDASQLDVEIDGSIDTRYQQRAASLPLLARRILRWLEECPGNCIVYFPSHQYLRDCLELIHQLDPGVAGRRLWQQSGARREELLELLVQRRDVAAFCILGGVFGEGVDLPGDQLASVVVVGVGLPQVGREREQLRQWHDDRGEPGFEFAYRYPGMQKVAQALGRVVRTHSDRGRALLIDPRYRDARYRELLPPWWRYGPATDI